MNSPSIDSGSMPRMGHLAGLDGLRAIAVAVVVMFHLWPWVMPGGFLGVSLFFTLSGYLITATALHERAATGRVSVAAFYARRARRLLAASLVTIAVVVVVWSVAGWYTQQVGDNSLAAVLQVANWQRIIADQPYGSAAESLPLLHFWSLAIEEQVYWVFPLFAVVGVNRRRFAVPLVVVLAASVGASWWWQGDSVAVYYSTLTRSGELVVGALAALLLHASAPPRFMVRAGAPVAALSVLAFLALCRASSLDTPAYYQGGLLLVGLLSAVMVSAVVASPGAGRALDRPALVWIGRRSYGVYLVHWPLLVGLRAADVSAAEWWALAATLVVAAASYRFLETPVRTRRAITWQPAWVAVATVAWVAVATVALPNDRAAGIDFAAVERAARDAAAAGSAGASLPPSSDVPGSTMEPGPTATSVAASPVTYALYGDSKALVLGLSASAYQPEAMLGLPGHGGIGCPLGRDGNVRSGARSGRGTDPDPLCDWTTAAAATVPADGLDLAVAYYGSWDTVERNPPSLGGEWLTLDDEPFREWLYSEMLTFTDSLLDAGARQVVWLTLYERMGTPTRVEIYNAMLADVARDRPGLVHVIDLGGWFAQQPDVDRLLPDGKHTTWGEGDPGTGLEVLDRYLGAELLALAQPA